MARDDTEFEELDLDNLEEVQEKAEIEGQKTLQSGTPDVDVVTDQDPEIEIVDEDEDAPKEEKKAQEKPQEDAPKKSKSRAQRRIRNLANEKNELSKQLEQERREKFELEQRLKEQSHNSAKSQRQILEDQMRSLKDRRLRALEDGNWKAHADLDDAIADTNLKIRVLDYEVNNTPPQRREYEPQQPAQPSIPEAAQDWADENKWFIAPKSQDEAIKRQAALVISADMINEGIDATSDEFYSELDNRLNSKFSTQEEAPKQETKNKDDHPVIGGSGRQAPVRKSGRNVVRLTKEERDYCDSMGITPQQYVRQRQAVEKSDGGWTEILK